MGRDELRLPPERRAGPERRAAPHAAQRGAGETARCAAQAEGGGDEVSLQQRLQRSGTHSTRGRGCRSDASLQQRLDARVVDEERPRVSRGAREGLAVEGDLRVRVLVAEAQQHVDKAEHAETPRPEAAQLSTLSGSGPCSAERAEAGPTALRRRKARGATRRARGRAWSAARTRGARRGRASRTKSSPRGGGLAWSARAARAARESTTTRRCLFIH